jgi:glycosyltransferase involved in cell wall biosynthesis
MNVAYDLRFAVDHFTGIGTHAASLLTALLERPDSHRYTVLWNPGLAARRFDVSWIARHPRVTWVETTWRPLQPIDPLRVGAWLRRLGPDVFLSPFYLYPPAAGCPVVLTLHDVNPITRPAGLSGAGRALFQVALAAARQARMILTSSEFSASELVRHGRLPHDRVRAIPLGVPRRPAVVAKMPSGVPAGPFAIVVGENRPRKNLQVLVRAWKRLRHEDIALVGVGRQDARYPSLASMASERARGRPIHSLGWVGEHELAWLYAHATLVLYPSCYEGFGFPLVEAFDAGVPVVAADIPVFREVARSAASYAPPDDPRAWAAAIDRLAGDPRARQALVAAGRERAAQLSYGQTAAATVAALQEAAAGLRTAAAAPVRIAARPQPSPDSSA